MARVFEEVLPDTSAGHENPAFSLTTPLFTVAEVAALYMSIQPRTRDFPEQLVLADVCGSICVARPAKAFSRAVELNEGRPDKSRRLSERGATRRRTKVS